MFLLCLGTSLKGPLIHLGSVGLLEKSTRACSLRAKQQGGDVLFGTRGLQFEQSSEHSGAKSVWIQFCLHTASCSGRQGHHE